MKKGKKEFCHESLQDSETIAELLSSLQQGLREGSLTFSDDDGRIELKPAGLLNFAIRASRSSELNALDLRISWQDSRPDRVRRKIRVSADSK